MTTLTHHSTLFPTFFRQAFARSANIEVQSMDGAAHGGGLVVASLTGILCGFDTSVVAGITSAAKIIFPSTLERMLEASAAGRCDDRYGGHDMLRVVGSLYLISSRGCAPARSLLLLRADSSFVACRFIAAVAVGGFSMLALHPSLRSHRRTDASTRYGRGIVPTRYRDPDSARRRQKCFSSRCRRRGNLGVFVRDFSGRHAGAVAPSAARHIGFRKRRSPEAFR